MKKIYFLFLFLFTFSFFLSAQTTVVLSASQDNTIYSENTTNSNGAGPNFTTGQVLNSAVRRGLLMFDLSSIPSGAIITAVSLNLVMNRTISGASNVSLHRLNEGWGEGGSNAGSGADGMGAPAQSGDATWICSFSNGAGGCTTSWTISGGAFQATASATTSVSGNNPYTWSSGQMITDVQNWVNNAAANFGWAVIGDETDPGSAKRFSSKTNPTGADRPSLSVTYTTVVPITLRYFKAQAQNSGTRLSWQTAQEINNDFFEIEFSSDAVSFVAVGKIKGKANSSLPQSYNFTHYTTKTGKVFYRLSQTDLNGRKSYSQIEAIELKNNIPALIISPNPVVNKLTVPGLVIDGEQRYVIINSLGEKVADAALLTQEIMLPNKIIPGLYILKITHSDGSVRSGSFIKY